MVRDFSFYALPLKRPILNDVCRGGCLYCINITFSVTYANFSVGNFDNFSDYFFLVFSDFFLTFVSNK